MEFVHNIVSDMDFVYQAFLVMWLCLIPAFAAILWVTRKPQGD